MCLPQGSCSWRLIYVTNIKWDHEVFYHNLVFAKICFFAGKDYVLPTKDNIMMCFITELVYKRNPNPSPSFCTNPRSFPSSLSTPVPCCQKRGWCAVADCGTHWWADWWSRQLSPHPGSRVLCNWSTEIWSAVWSNAPQHRSNCNLHSTSQSDAKSHWPFIELPSQNQRAST